MKNLFFLFVVFSITSATSITVSAQHSLRFIDNIEIIGERRPAHFANNAPQDFQQPISAVNIPSAEMCNSLQFKYAQMTDQEVEKVRNLRLYKVIDEWYSVRYRLGGNSKKGIDCSSFTSLIFDAVYSQCLPRTAREQFDATYRLNQEELQEGDLVFFNTRGGISHVGVYLANGYFVHAGSSSGVVISHLSESYFSARYKGAGRLESYEDLTISNQ